jgi:hypothetical protein
MSRIGRWLSRTAILAAIPCAVARADVAPGDAPKPPFAAFVERVHVGVPVTVGRLGAVLLWASAEAGKPLAQAGAWVGLEGSGAQVDDLPAPVGDAAVRVSNGLEAPLYLPRGETLTSPPGSGASRVVDRPTWIPARSAAYVPLAQPAAGAIPPPPYSPGADRASPALLRGMRLDRWETALLQDNAALGVDAFRRMDAIAGYASAAFARWEPMVVSALEGARDALPGPAVGLGIVDHLGLVTLVLGPDAARFRAEWPALARGVALDDAVRETRNAPHLPPLVLAKAVEEALSALAELRAEPAARPAYGAGEQVRWPAAGTPHWVGLVVDGKPVAATWHRIDDPVPQPGPGGSPPPPNPPPHEPPKNPVPGGAELDRREPRTPFEERLKERRDAAMGGGG